MKTLGIHLVVLLIGLTLGAGSLAFGQSSQSGRSTDLTYRVWKLERAVGNLCVEFKHPPQVNDLALRKWFYDVGLTCPTYRLH